jgi:Cof subfamily protein (haloacid dehalogenase superfamily)
MTADRAGGGASVDGTLCLLVCDLDGTLLEADGSISERTRAAVQAVRQSGIRVAVATGRVPIGIASVVRALDLEGPQITMHGALVIAPMTGETVYSVTLGPDEVDELLAVAAEIDMPVLLCYPDGFRTNDLRQEVIDLFVPFNEPLPEEVKDLASLRFSQPHKIAIWTGAERYDAALETARERLGDRYTITSGDNRSIELLARGVDKGRAAGELARWMGLSLDEVGAIGDGTNDIELLAAAHRSVAMRHARPEVRQAADLVVPDEMPDDAASAIGLLLDGALRS